MTDFETHPIGTAKRIEELKAKLAKAVKSLHEMLDDPEYWSPYARATLAELEGKPHG